MVGAIHIRHRAISFGISFVAAAVMIVYGGFLLIVGSATPAIKRGKEIIRDALIGLLVLIGSYIILQTVNPETLALKALKVPVVKNIPAEEGDAPAVVQEQKERSPRRIRQSRTGKPYAIQRILQVSRSGMSSIRDKQG